MFDRYVEKELRGIQPRDVIRLISRENCERRCLEEKRFVCRSANYYKYSQECRLYSEEQSFPHTQLTFAGGVDYLENQCNIGMSNVFILSFLSRHIATSSAHEIERAKKVN